MRREQRSYGKLPLIVLTESEQGDLQENKADKADPLSPAQQRAAWIEQKHLKDRIAALSSCGVNFVVDGSEHDIALNHPTAVISAVDEVVDQARYSVHSERSPHRSLP